MRIFKTLFLIVSILLGFTSCESDDSITQEAPEESYIDQAKDILVGDIVLSTRATMNGVDKTLLPEGCPTKFNFSWKEDGMMVLNLVDFHVGAMPFIMIMWGSYLLLMFCYDDVFLGVNHPVTIFVGVGCLVGSFFIFAKQLHIASWGANIRMAIATVVVFWTPVEILGRMDFFSEIWVAPMEHKTEMISILVAFAILAVYLWLNGSKKRSHPND